jgi:hypothetical protein
LFCKHDFIAFSEFGIFNASPMASQNPLEVHTFPTEANSVGTAIFPNSMNLSDTWFEINGPILILLDFLSDIDGVVSSITHPISYWRFLAKFGSTRG